MKKIVVVGDVAIDWVNYPVSAEEQGDNWRLYDAHHYHALRGGALLQAKFIREVCAHDGLKVEVVSHRSPTRITVVPPSEVIHSNVTLANFPTGEDRKNSKLRVNRFLGYMGPSGKDQPSPQLAELDGDPSGAEIIVVDDAGNGFRNRPDSWPISPEVMRKSTVVYKVSRPLAEGALWRELLQNAPSNLVVLVNAADIRTVAGVSVSRSLSWERTAKELLHEMRRCPTCLDLQRCPNLIVLFGHEGAILYKGGAEPRATLIFDPGTLEGDCASDTNGGMMGERSLLAASVVAGLAGQGLDRLGEGVRTGLQRARNLLLTGFRLDPDGVSYPLPDVLATEGSPVYVCSEVDRVQKLNDPDPSFWRLLDSETADCRPLVAEELVQVGKAPALAGVPTIKFGGFVTRDRLEIEHISAIRELIVEYLENEHPEHPLCFAVFGPPGSGKSFAVKQIVKGLKGRGGLAEKARTFNVSQFTCRRDLIAAFHEARDIRLGGQVPFVFFDEFDAALDGNKLAWLSSFLAPMQDGLFKDGETAHPIGKAVFAFAGGTRHTFEKFQKNESGDGSSAIAKDAPNFDEVKGPDFVSRLRGFIDVMGPNRQRKTMLSKASPAADTVDDDDAFVIRRANLLRVLLKKDPTCRGLFRPSGRLEIHAGVLRALLHVRNYRHGSRSMEAILEMSRLVGKDVFDQSCLPAKEQLDLHVEADEFLWLCKRERFLSLLRWRDLKDPERPYRQVEYDIVQPLARAIHGDYQGLREAEKKQSDTVVPFEKLPPDKVASNIDAAEHVPTKLRSIRCSLRSIPEGQQVPLMDFDRDIGPGTVELLAEMEHERWNAEQALQGWRYAEGKKNAEKRTTPYMLPYAVLKQRHPDVAEYDVQAVKALPKALAALGYEIYAMTAARKGCASGAH